MSRVLIAYSTVDGHTLTICHRLKQLLERSGHVVSLVEIAVTAKIALAMFDKIVIGASVRYGKHRLEVYRFIETHRQVLEQRPSAFFTVNLVARKRGKNSPESNPYLKAFRRKTTWVPRVVAAFAGKIDYPKYGFLDRQIIRLIMWLTDGPIDPSACVEFTNWEAVEEFARRVSEMGSS
jgi:menaquinone-dependent protoporphyrinogen oxidase